MQIRYSTLYEKHLLTYEQINAVIVYIIKYY